MNEVRRVPLPTLTPGTCMLRDSALKSVTGPF